MGPEFSGSQQQAPRGRCWSPSGGTDVFCLAPSFPRPTSPIYSITRWWAWPWGPCTSQGPLGQSLGKLTSPLAWTLPPYLGDPGVSSVAAQGGWGGWGGVGVRNPPSRPGSDLWKQNQTGPTLPLRRDHEGSPLGRDTAPHTRTEGTCWSGCGFPVLSRSSTSLTFDVSSLIAVNYKVQQLHLQSSTGPSRHPPSSARPGQSRRHWALMLRPRPRSTLPLYFSCSNLLISLCSQHSLSPGSS